MSCWWIFGVGLVTGGRIAIPHGGDRPITVAARGSVPVSPRFRSRTGRERSRWETGMVVWGIVRATAAGIVAALAVGFVRLADRLSLRGS